MPGSLTCRQTTCLPPILLLGLGSLSLSWLPCALRSLFTCQPYLSKHVWDNLALPRHSSNLFLPTSYLQHTAAKLLPCQPSLAYLFWT